MGRKLNLAVIDWQRVLRLENGDNEATFSIKTRKKAECAHTNDSSGRVLKLFTSDEEHLIKTN
jgi:hypothetical protein